MDHQTFDRLTRLFGIAGSRRTAWRALIAGALLGTTARSAAATPAGEDRCDATRCPKTPQGEAGFCCPGKQQCSCNGTCCPGKTGCFVSTSDENKDELCCTRPELIICGDQCCRNVGEDPCTECLGPHPDLISGSYRRR
jgi:hypothetical protein